MRLNRVAVLGGGPGGFYAARLLKLAQPSCEVVVYEQSRPDTTFGFGIGLAGNTQRNLETADPDSLRELLADGVRHDMELRVGDAVCGVSNGALIGIARTRLLGVLQQYAEKAGVVLEFGARVDAHSLDADLVIAADGVSSATRTARAEEFGATVETDQALYLWAATDFALDKALFEPVRTQHGTFVTHAYPYQSARSTFLIETDTGTWSRAGLSAAAAGLPADASDEHSLRYLEGVFERALQGHRLMGNRTQWLRFRTVRTQRWHAGNIVLLGDAAHTAHYSIGSGTKLAMEDAIALVDALDSAQTLDEALTSYEAVRRPAVERLQSLAHRSQLWWDSFPERLGTGVDQLMVAYMSRAGNVPLPRFAASNPAVVRRALQGWCGETPASLSEADLDGWVLDRPLVHPAHTAPSRRHPPRSLPVVPLDSPRAGCLAAVPDVPAGAWSADADTVIEQAGRARDAGALGFWLGGRNDRESVLDRLNVGERLRRATGGLVVAALPEALSADAAAALVSDRVDLVELRRA